MFGKKTPLGLARLELEAFHKRTVKLEALHRAEDLVRAELYPIHRLAEALRQRRVLSGEEAERIHAAARAELAQSSAGSFQEPGSHR